jgi:DNA-binding PadR family transcriptional regulator
MADAVEAITEWQRLHERFADAILEGYGWHPKQADAILERAEREGFIESGVSSRSGWLTDKGKALLAEVGE